MPTMRSYIINKPTTTPTTTAQHPLVGKRVRAWVEWRMGGFYDSSALKPTELFRNGEYREGTVLSVRNGVAEIRVYKHGSSRVVTAMVGECVIMTRE